MLERVAALVEPPRILLHLDSMVLEVVIQEQVLAVTQQPMVVVAAALV